MSLLEVVQYFGGGYDSNHVLSPRVAYTDDDTHTAGVSIDPLPHDHRKGLIAVFIMAILSTIATLLLIGFITYRLIFWRSNYARYIGYNQYIILIYNLVIADLLQSLAFLICAKWYAENKVQTSTAACFLQGFWLQIGDPASGIFVLAIAFHTFYMVALGRKLSYRTFVAIVVGLWGFVAILVIIPLGAHGKDVFVPSGAWCWISENYEPMRLWTHYVWIFLAEFGTVSLYAVLWFQLRRRIKQSAILGSTHIESLRRLRRVVGYMVIYPIAYIVLSLPLAAGRMATARGDTPSVVYFCVSGALITSSGLVDVLLYTLTRKNLILDSEPSADRSYNKFSGMGRGDYPLPTDPKNMRTDISALRTFKGGDEGGLTRDGSTDDIMQAAAVEMAPMGKVYQHTTIQITSEPAYPSSSGPDDGGRSSGDSVPPTGRSSAQGRWGR
ncbi:G protein-coupled glucose receptor regulating Gpa2-domain-containing protein [Aspergillus pseudoustus]|uniref:G protein-coupled glucose receptor regulating Gpa2-domain-containing protein n=1 Tax=Aspergillus pseudoustus TaxID=1810923 RepID=A0ABR4J2D5_9EURO